MASPFVRFLFLGLNPKRYHRFQSTDGRGCHCHHLIFIERMRSHPGSPWGCHHLIFSLFLLVKLPVSFSFHFFTSPPWLNNESRMWQYSVKVDSSDANGTGTMFTTSLFCIVFCLWAVDMESKGFGFRKMLQLLWYKMMKWSDLCSHYGDEMTT